VVGQDLVFNVAREEAENLRVIDPLGRARTVPAPWVVDNRFGIARLVFDRLSAKR